MSIPAHIFSDSFQASAFSATADLVLTGGGTTANKIVFALLTTSASGGADATGCVINPGVDDIAMTRLTDHNMTRLGRPVSIWVFYDGLGSIAFPDGDITLRGTWANASYRPQIEGSLYGGADASPPYSGAASFVNTTNATSHSQAVTSAGTNSKVLVLAYCGSSITMTATGDTSTLDNSSPGTYAGLAAFAEDGTGGSDTLNWTTSSNDIVARFGVSIDGTGAGADTTPPDITSTGTGSTNGPFAANVAENSTAAFITLTANEDVTWGALGGADAARFTKLNETATTVQLGLSPALNFESLPHANPFVVTVTATDGSGNARSVTVNATVTNVNEPPGAPTGVTATAGNASASVAFTPPADNGGPTPTNFIVTSTPGSITAEGASSPIVVPGLTNDIAYTFVVNAENSEGVGPASAPSSPVTPAAVTYSITSPAGGFAPNTGSGARAAGTAFNWWAFAAKQIGDSLSGATMQTGSGTLNGSGQAVLSGLTLSGSWECQVRFADGGTARWTGTAA